MILPKEFAHLRGTVLGDHLEGVIIRTWIGWAVKGIFVAAVVAACVVYVWKH